MYEFEAVPDYWAGWSHETSPDVFRYIVYRESSSARLALEAGEIDWSVNLSEEDIASIQSKPGFATILRPSLVLDFIFMNTASDGPTGDPNVRKALAYAFDYAAAEKAVFDLSGGNTLVPASLPGAVEFEDLQKTDLDLAKEYLAKSDWPDGGFDLDYVYIGGFPPEEDAGLVLIASMAELNIGINMVPKTWSELVELCTDPETTGDFVNIYIGAIYADLYSMLFQSFAQPENRDYTTCHWYIDPDVQALVNQSASETNEEARLGLYQDVQQKLYDARFGILVGASYLSEAHSNQWQTDVFTPIWAYVGYLDDYYQSP
jgi:peptide/nickel transport system substrate-binding protein